MKQSTGNQHKPLKDYFGSELAHRLADLIRVHHPSFPVNSFVQAISQKTPPLALKRRVAIIAEELKNALPDDYTKAIRILMAILGPENETEEGMFTNGYFLMPVAYYVEKYGLDDFDISMQALVEITKRHTSEYAMRPYIVHDPHQSLRYLHKWVHDDNLHVRRFASECTRPYLPWAKRMKPIHDDIRVHFTLLAHLLDDSSKYVRKSVANHIHDLSKMNKTKTINWLHEQLNAETRSSTHMPWIIRHGLRSHIKANDTSALELLEYAYTQQVDSAEIEQFHHFTSS